MTTLHHARQHPQIFIGPRTREAITIQLEELALARKKTRDRARRAEIDARVRILESLIAHELPFHEAIDEC